MERSAAGPAPRFYAFGPYLLDPVRRLLWRERQPVPLTSRAFDILVLLIERRPDVVDKDALLTAIWGDVVVEEATVVRHISTLRKALHVRPDEHDLLVTIPGRGYRFVAQVDEIGELPEDLRPGTRGLESTGSATQVSGAETDDRGHAMGSEAAERPVGAAVSGPEPSDTRRRTPRTMMVIGTAATLLVLVWWAATRAAPPTETPRTRRLHQVTFDAGLPRNPAWSPDGRSIAYTSDRAGNPDIWVQAIDDPNPVRLTTSAAADWQPDWSPDGQWIVFRSEREGGGLYVIPAQGGDERRLTMFGYGPKWSPDSRTVLFSSTPLRTGELPRLYVTGRDNGAARPIRPDLTQEFRSLYAGWHPDGRVSLWGQHRTKGWTFLTAPLEAGQAVASSGVAGLIGADEKAVTLRRFVWAPRGDALYFEGATDNVRNIWRVAIEPASLGWISAPERLTTSVASDTEIALSPDGRRVAFRAHAEHTRFWAFSLESDGTVAGSGEPLTSGEGRELQPDAPAAGNKLVYQAVRGAHRELRELSLVDRREQVLVSSTEPIDRALWSPDGSRLGYLRRLSDQDPARAELIVLRAAGSVEARYALGGPTTSFRPSDWSPDGGWMLGGCRPHAAGRLAVCALDVRHPSLEPAVITSHPDLNLFQQRLSPDGLWITFMAADPLEAGTSAIHVVPAAGGAWTPMTDGRQFDDKPIWSADGRTLYYLSNRGAFFNVWGRRFDPATGQPIGPPFQVTSFHSPRLMISPDNIPSVGIAVAGDRLVVPITEASGQLWILEDVGR